ncbi:hypothetical protein TIFTF001_016601 [Ficus carica]|uniref:Uncharacterized protein n=1 Tax=Ficus carica TaxID=3494 RepID=A0AA88ATG8_FICCA|nr:hypothetical protein TIFTF001_016601 [Ficus carica]
MSWFDEALASEGDWWFGDFDGDGVKEVFGYIWPDELSTVDLGDPMVGVIISYRQLSPFNFL